MKIIYCIAGTFNSGGMERVLANKANWLIHNGYDVTIVTTDQQNRPNYFTFSSKIKFIDLGINYAENNHKGLLSKILNYPIKQRLHLKGLRKVVKELNPDLIISMFDSEVNLIPQLKDDSKKIVEIHFSRFKRLQYGRKGLWKLIDKWRFVQDQKIIKKYDRFIVLTREDQPYWGEMSTIQVIPNASTFPVMEYSPKSEYKRAIAIGRLGHQKNFVDLIDIWALIQSRYPDWKLDIFGEGEYRESLQQHIDSLGLCDVISLKKNTTSIQQELLLSSVFLMSSFYEGLPMAMLEAQACGVPVISYTCKCGPKDIIEDGENGFLIQEGDINQFAECLMLFMDSEDLQHKMQVNALKLAHRYEEEIIMSQWDKLFVQLTNPKYE